MRVYRNKSQAAASWSIHRPHGSLGMVQLRSPQPGESGDAPDEERLICGVQNAVTLLMLCDRKSISG